MDVTLVLTHRCNLACHYCYSGEHFRKEMDDATLERALDLLYADGADTAQLGFFGGEPFLAFETMRRAVEGAGRRARQAGRRLLLQCTTNGTVLHAEQVAFVATMGMRVTVSVDGIREAHERNRPSASGASSFDLAHRGLQLLVDAGVRPDVLMVITPATAPFVFRSVSWLWEQGIRRVRANLAVDTAWSELEKTELREELLAVGFDLLARRLRGEDVAFDPFGTVDLAPSADSALSVRCGAARPRRRGQIVVATSGNLYPCAPMVGEDRDSGREAARRLGHLDDGLVAIVARVVREGEGCGDGQRCACAAWLETGDPTTTGPNGIWFGRLSAEIGKGIAQALAQAPRIPVARPHEPEGGRPVRPDRRPWIVGLALGAGAALLGGSAVYSMVFSRTLGGMRPVVIPPPDPALAEPLPVELPTLPPPEPAVPMPGQMVVPLEPPPPDPRTLGEMTVAPPAAPPADEPHVRGRMRLGSER